HLFERVGRNCGHSDRHVEQTLFTATRGDDDRAVLALFNDGVDDRFLRNGRHGGQRAERSTSKQDRTDRRNQAQHLSFLPKSGAGRGPACKTLPQPILKPEPGFNFRKQGEMRVTEKSGKKVTDTEPTERSAAIASEGKQPRTARGQRTLRTILDAAAAEFGEKGFHEGSISGITRRAGVALGSFYTYFDSKDAVFRAL